MDKDEVVFKKEFIERYSRLTNFEEFKRYSLSYPRRSIRVNTLKISINELLKRLKGQWNLTQIPWCKDGFWIEHKQGERRDIGNLIEHSLGFFYIQEPASMIPPIVLNPKPHEFILDMCSAPGSKSTQIAQYMRNTGILIANDYKGDRLASLGINIQRIGITNTIITLMSAKKIKGFEFDRILLDAPCSGTGTIRKSFKTISIWNPNMVVRLALQQKQLIDSAVQNLKNNGVLVYSTCSLEPDENEGVIDFILNRYDELKLEEIKLPIKRSQAILRFEGKIYNKELEKCLRIWPQDNDTDGFFVAKIRKKTRHYQQLSTNFDLTL